MRYLLLFLLLFSTPAFADQVNVQVRFCEQTEVGEYCDALYFPMESYASSAWEVHDLKAQRVSNYVTQVKNPHAPVEPTKAELEEAKASLQSQIAELDVKIQEKGK